MRAEALTDKTATHRRASPVSDPSELGSEPDSCLECKDNLRTRKIMGKRVTLGGQATHGRRSAPA